MDHETDFLTPDFLYLLVFAQRNIIIYPFTYQEKLKRLTALLDPIFTFIDFDVSDISNLDTVSIFLQQIEEQNQQVVDGSHKQTIILFPNGCSALLELVTKYPKTRFISLEKDAPKATISPEVAIIFNKKLQTFANWNFTASKPSKMEYDAFHWCEFIITELRQTAENPSISQEIQQFWASAQEFFQILADFSLQKYVTFIHGFNEIEKSALRYFADNYFQINTANIIPDDKTIQENTVNLLDIERTDSSTVLDKASHDLKNQILQNAEPSEPTLGKIKLKERDPYLEFVELSTKYPLISAAITVGLADQVQDSQFTPEQCYIELRKIQWPAGIPLEFLVKIFTLYLKETIKSAKISPDSFVHYAQEQHKQFVDALSCCPYAPEFNQFAKLPITQIREQIMAVNKKTTKPAEVLPKSFAAKTFGKEKGETLPNETHHLEAKSPSSFEAKYLESLTALKKRFALSQANVIVQLTYEFDQLQMKIKNKM